jgi:hypothetical protein
MGSFARSWIKRLEVAARAGLESFVLEDGSRHYYDAARGGLFLHYLACMRAQGRGEITFPEPSETLRALVSARDRASALEQVAGGPFGLFPYDEHVFVECGELVPRSLVAGRELGEPIEDLSE